MEPTRPMEAPEVVAGVAVAQIQLLRGVAVGLSVAMAAMGCIPLQHRVVPLARVVDGELTVPVNSDLFLVPVPCALRFPALAGAVPLAAVLRRPRTRGMGVPVVP